MRDYGRVHSTVWASPTFTQLSDDGKMLALYLLTCSHSTIAGVFRMPDGYAAEDLNWTAGRVSEGFRELFSVGFANRCETTKWVLVEKHLDWNPPENPNQRKAAAKVAASVPDECAWKQAFMRVRAESLGLEAAVPVNPSATVGQPFLNQEQEQEQKKETLPPGGGDVKPQAVKAEPPGFKTFWADWPKSERKGGKAKCLSVWLKAGLEEAAPVILAHLAVMKASPTWRKEEGQYIPAPLAYLNGRKWDGADVQVESSYAGAV